MSAFQYAIATPHFHLAMLALAGAMAFQGLVAIWAATSRIHWIWRALAVFGAVMLLVPIRTYEPALVFAMASPLVVAIVTAYRWLLSQRKSPDRHEEVANLRFSLRDLFLVIFIAGLSLAGLLAIVPRLSAVEKPHGFVVAALAIACITALSHCAIAGPRRWAAGILLVVALAVSAIALPAQRDLKLGWRQLGVVYEFFPEHSNPAIIALLLTELAAAIAAAVLLASIAWRPTASKWRIAARIMMAAYALPAGLALAALYWQMLWLTPFPPPIASGKNHYARISTIAAAQRTDLLAELLPLLDNPNHVPFDPATDLREDYWMGGVSTARDLGRALSAEAAASPPDRAAEWALANVRLGGMLRRGGLLLQEVIGVAVEDIGHADLARIRDQLSPSSSSRALAVLRRTHAELEAPEAIHARDRAYMERTYGWEEQFGRVLDDAIYGNVEHQGYDGMRQRSHALNALLQTDLAVRLFRHERGRLPQTLAELVPVYLPEVPLDPYSQKPLIYQAEDDNFVLYSVGEDGVDNGGRCTPEDRMPFDAPEGFDLNLD
jgi:hypothetical protein